MSTRDDDIIYSATTVDVARDNWGAFWALGIEAQERGRRFYWLSIKGLESYEVVDPNVRRFNCPDIPADKVDALREVCIIPPEMVVGLR